MANSNEYEGRMDDASVYPEEGREDQSGKAMHAKAGKSRRGFAAMDPERQREIASAGGKAAHAKGTAHQWTSEEARRAGREGGRRSRSGGRESA